MMSLNRGGVALVLLTALLSTACRQGGAEESGAAVDDAIVLSEADLATAVRSEIGTGVALTGSLQPALVVRVNAQVPGNITNIRVDRGVRVSQGQPMATISAEGIRGAAEGARAGVASAEANLAVARQRHAAAKTLRDAGAMSQLDYQAAEAALAAAEAQLAAARAQAAGAIESAQRATVSAPISGVVGSRMVNDGESVNPGQELFTIVRSDVLELAGQVPVDAAARIATGQPVVFTLEAYPGREFKGQVARIEPMADPATRQVGVYMQMRNPGNLIGGQFATGRILSERADTAVVVPETAVHRSGAETFVLAVQGDRVVKKPVTLGGINTANGTIAVLSGVNAGDRIIARATSAIAENTRVRIAAPKPGASPSEAGRGH